MLFYDPLFLTIFPVVYVFYWAIVEGQNRKKWTLIVASALFYIWGEPLFVVLLLLSILIDYMISFCLTDTTPLLLRKSALAIGIASNLLILAFYKYADFIAENINLVLGSSNVAKLPLLHVALPIGVSFVVFEKITYLVDTYRGISRPAPRLSDYCLFVLFFPKLLAGPILKYHEMSHQLLALPTINLRDFGGGGLRFARGLGRKLLIADPVGTFANQIFAVDPAGLSTGSAWVGLLAFTLQIYFDFSGYSDMAIGLARMFGIGLRENFDAPYTSQSITEFWLRWHISLTTWIREYLYVPLGGNRLGSTRTYINLWLCFLASGFWHGASWNFLLWGAYNGVFLTLDRVFLRQLLARCGPFIATLTTLLIVMIGWAIFRSETFPQLQSFLETLAGFSTSSAPLTVSNFVMFSLVVGSLISIIPATPVYPALIRSYEKRSWLRAINIASIILVFVLSLSRVLTEQFQPFIYFRF